MHPAIQSEKIAIQPSDEMLIDRARNGHLESFEAIFYRHNKPIYEFAYLLTGESKLAEKILLKSFLFFHHALGRYTFRETVLVCLLCEANRLVRQASKPLWRRAARGGNTAAAIHTVSLEDKALWILANRFNLSIGALSTIIRKKPVSIMARLKVLSTLALENLVESIPEFPSHDYFAVLVSKIRTNRTKKRTVFLVLLMAGGLAGLGGSLYDNFLSRPRESLHNETALDINQGTVYVQDYSSERNSFFRVGQSFAEESVRMIPGYGKALTVDYELFKSYASAGIEISLRKEMDLSEFNGFQCWVWGDPDIGFPSAITLQFKKDRLITFECPFGPISGKGHLVKVPIVVRAQALFNKVVFMFGDTKVQSARSGRIYLDRMILTREEKP